MDIASDYGQDRELIKQFFADYTDVNEDGELRVKYKDFLTSLANRELRHIHVELADVEKYNQDLAKSIVSNTLRYNQIFYQAIDEILPSYKTKDVGKKDITDVFIEQRLYVSERNQRNLQNAGRTAAPASAAGLGSQAGVTRAGVTDIDGQYPPDLVRRGEVYFKPSSLQATPIREVRAKHVGTLVNIRGIVTRVTDVKPKVTIVCYTCDQCGCETFQPVSDDFMPLNECTSAVCKNNKVLGKITPQLRGSKFVKYQEIKIQEHSDQVPTGNIPRAVSVMACGELTRQCSPGDHISVSGVFLPIERSGYGLRNGGLAADTKIEAHYITLMTKTEDQELNNEPMTLEEARVLINDGQHFLSRLSSSIAPEIFGHEQLKKALLLLLVGGVETNQHGMKVRGNINICLMGDPGVAKSQLLSFIDRLAPRSQYTTGRGSSGVGLTAAVLKDPITNELVLEGGALVLADKGICCIDEFDKMMDADRTAIHEVMEQQTVSIAKAGIMTTLNARVSILAAANPAYGRYDLHRTISENLELPPALLSRFDLLWLIRDQPDRRTDLDLADHITTVHKKPNETADYDAIDMRSMRRYINLCKTIDPIVPEELSDRFVQIYLEIRARKRAKTGTDALFTSPRSLLAIMRLTTALARLRLSEVVESADISVALELYNHSRDSIEGSLGEYVSEVNDFRSFLQRISAEKGTLELNRDMVHELAEAENFPNEFVSQALAKLSSMEALSYDGDTIFLVDNPFL